MLPIVFTIAIPAAWAKLVAVAVALLVVSGRLAYALARARRAGDPVGVVALLREDRTVIGILAAAVAVLWWRGLLSRDIRLPLHSYGLLIAAAFLLGIWLAQREARRRGQDAEKIADLAFWILVAALAGSRVYFILVNFGDYFGPGNFLVRTALFPVPIPKVLAFWEGGLVFYGGLIAAALTAWWYLRRHGMGFLAHADTMIPSVAFGHFLGRLGCWGAGCCWGAPAHDHLPWAAHFRQGSLAYDTFRNRADPSLLSPDGLSTVGLHPTQLYESFGELGLFLLLVLVVRPRKAFHGQVLATWLMAYAVLRAVVELFRGDVERGVILGFGVGAWTSLAIFSVGALVWLRNRPRRGAGEPGAEPAAA